MTSVAAALAFLVAGTVPTFAIARGVVVDTAKPAGPAAQAGLSPGDILLRWRRDRGPGAPTAGDLASPFDLAQAEAEEAPRGTVFLKGQRGNQTITVEFEERWLMVQKNVMAGGTVHVGVVTCDTACPEAQVQFFESTAVTLKAEAAASFRFVGWEDENGNPVSGLYQVEDLLTDVVITAVFE